MVAQRVLTFAVHGETSKPNTDECRNRIGEQMEHDPEGHETNAEREKEGDPAPQERQDVEMPVEAPGESASVKRGSDAVADNEERARLQLRAQGKRGQKHDVQDELEPKAKTRARPEWRRARSVKAHNLSQNWRKNVNNSRRLELQC